MSGIHFKQPSIRDCVARYTHWMRRGAMVGALITGIGVPCRAAGISGTMSNFDVFNDTSSDAYGAELELEGVHSNEVSATYPSHFNNKSVEDYSTGTTFGTRIKFSGYNFDPQGFLAPSVGQSTNGHFCVNIQGCEHFGFAVSQQPTATRYFWLDQNQQRIGTVPMAVPNATWAYVPPANGGGNQAVVQAEVEMPEPAEAHAQRPDSVWMKVYKTEIERPVKLEELMSNNGIVPEDAGETETEWELLEGGKNKMAEGRVREKDKAVIRRYEFFKYTGLYDDEHEPLSKFLDDELDAPPADELGAFIAANMVAVNLGEIIATPGDFNNDGQLDISDMDALTQVVQSGDHLAQFDLNADGQVTAEDRRVWVEDLKRTWFGDTTLDGVFDSSDLIGVFQAGQYEDAVVGNSTWGSGDWNGDGDFDTSDLITAFQSGGYDQGVRASIAAVPESASWTLGSLAMLGLAAWRRRRSAP